MREGWERVVLGDLIEKRKDFTPVEKHQEYRCAGVQRSGWGLLERAPFDGSRTTFSKLMQLEKDDLVYRTITAFEAPSAVVEEEHAGLFVSPQTFPVFRIDSARLLPAYMKLLTTSPSFHEAMASRCTGSVLRRMTLSVSAFESIPVDLPPLAEQRRIVDLIGAVDEAIEAAREQEQTSRRLVIELGAEAADRATQGTWPIVSLTDALGVGGVIQTGPFGSQLHQSDYQAAGTGVVMPTNMKDGRIVEKGMARIGSADATRLMRHRLRAGDIAWSRRGDVTRFAVVSAKQEGMICGTGCFLVRPADPSTSAWLEVWLATGGTARWLIDHAVGATMANLNTGILGAVPVVLPPDDERPAFIGTLLALSEIVDSASALADSNRRLRNELLTLLLSGEHEIPESYDRFLEGAAA